MHSVSTDVVPARFLGSPDSSAHRNWSWHKRVASAAHRRLRAWWRTPGSRHYARVIETAVEALNRRVGVNGLADRPGAPACPGLTAAMVPTLLTFGQIEPVLRLTTWLVATQRPDGSFPRAGDDVASLFNTAQSVAALLELESTKTVVAADAAYRAARYLDARLQSGTKGGQRRQTHAAVQLSLVPPLIAAARQFDVPGWEQTAKRTAARACNTVDWHLSPTASRLFAQAVEAWVALGQLERAKEALSWPAIRQTKRGGVAGDAAGAWGDNGLLAHLAAVWYRVGERGRADRALAFLAAQQLPAGGWPRYWRAGRHVRDIQSVESAWVAKYYLDACWIQGTSSFGSGCQLPQTIDPVDGRFVAVREWFAALGGAPKVADLGCGSGRFLRELQPRFPYARLVGVDSSAALLGRISSGVETRRGGLLRLPAAEAEFDGAFAVESLEHSLLPQQAVNEICRVVRPGGCVLIIDKHQDRQALSLHEPWEHWFFPDTVAAWLAAHCRDVRVRPIPHGPQQEEGLFLCWEGTKAYPPSAPRLAKNSLISPAA